MLARVLVGHRGSIVEVVHLRRGQRFTIGDHPRASWIVSHPSLPPLECVELVRVTTRGVELARPGETWQVLAANEAVRLELGEVWLHVSATPPERLKLSPRAPDWGLFVSSAVFGLIAAVFALLVHATPEVAPLEDASAEPAYVRLLQAPSIDAAPEQAPSVRRKPPPPPIPECDEKEAGRGAPKAAARKPSGAAEASEPARAQSRNRASSPPKWEPNESARGILGVLSQNQEHFLASPYAGAFSIGDAGGETWSGLESGSWEGYGGGQGGTGGMGLVGTGRGGGGTGQGTIGLGSTGLIGNGGGGGRACQVCIKKHKPRSKVQLGRSRVEGEHETALIRRVTKAKLRALQACYDTALLRDAKLRGEVELKYVLGRDGSVSAVIVEHTPDRSLGECMAKVVRITRFPAGSSAGSIIHQTITLGANQ